MTTNPWDDEVQQAISAVAGLNNAIKNGWEIGLRGTLQTEQAGFEIFTNKFTGPAPVLTSVNGSQSLANYVLKKLWQAGGKYDIRVSGFDPPQGIFVRKN